MLKGYLQKKITSENVIFKAQFDTFLFYGRDISYSKQFHQLRK